MLERGSYLIVSLLLSIVALATTSPASWLQQSGYPDFTSLSGVWEGRIHIIKAGKCSIEGSERKDYRVWIALDVAPDGSFTAIISQEKVKITRTWTGQFNKDLELIATGTGKAKCEQQSRDYKIDYTGKVKEKKGQLTLKIRGRDEACPMHWCVFNQTYELKRK